MTEARPTTIWDVLWDALTLLWWPADPRVCKDCNEILRGPEIEYGPYVSFRRVHFGDRCIPCQMREFSREMRPWVEKMNALSRQQRRR